MSIWTPSLKAVALAVLLGIASANAAELIALPSSTEIGEDENVSIQFKMTMESMGGTMDPPKFDAPDFDEVNTYSRASSMESRYMNGKFEVKRTQSIVTVLHPKKTGKLVIRGIEAKVDGQVVKAPDITVEVVAAGANRKGRGSISVYGQSNNLPQGGVHQPRQQAGNLFLRTEPSKLKAYKGEQIILTYSVYTRVQLVNIQVERYPNLVGFLKEDIDIPTLRNAWDFRPSVVNGQEYRRAPLAQYAIFPIKEGLLPLDVFTGKFSYQLATQPRIDPNDGEDPFNLFNQFFLSRQTTTDTRQSDRVSIEVLPLPAAGQPAKFSGLVGEFDITAVVDKYQVKVGEPLHVKVKIEGKGHAGSLETLSVAWPQEFELYEDKSNTQFFKTGRSERLFEYMVVPKTQGKFEVPAIEISMFNPESKAYQLQRTQPIPIEVLEGSLGNVYVAKETGKPKAGQPPAEDIRYWKDSSASTRDGWSRWVSRAVGSVSFALALAGLWMLAGPGDEAARRSRERAIEALRARVKALRETPSGEGPAQRLGEVESLLADILQQKFGIFVGSLTRAQVRDAVTSKVGPALAERVERLMESCENQRYAPGGGDGASVSQVVEELARLAADPTFL